MAARRPILSIAPEGELWDLVKDYPAAFAFRPSDSAGIATMLVREMERHLAGGASAVGAYDLSRYERRAEAGQLAGFLDTISSSSQTRSAAQDERLALVS